MEYTVREAEAEDLYALDILRRQAVEDGFSNVYPREAFADRVAGEDPRLRGWIESDTVQFLLVEHRFSPVCFGVFDPGQGRILGIYTAPDHQRRGWARKLVRRFERSAGAQGGEDPSAETCIEVVSPLNAVEFFRSLEFEDVETVRDEGLEMRLMRKTLRR